MNRHAFRRVLIGRAQRTSLIRYPAFSWDPKKERWTNYSGAPKPLSHFGDVIRNGFVPEIPKLRARAIFLCGSAVRDACRRLAAEGLIEDHRLVALPHPSPESRRSADDWTARRSALRKQVSALLRELD